MYKIASQANKRYRPTLNILLPHRLQVYVVPKGPPHGIQRSCPRHFRADPLILIKIMLRKPWLGIISVGRVREIERPSRPQSRIDPLLYGPSFALKPEDLLRAGHADLGPSEVDENADPDWVVGAGVGDGAGIVGD
jgi:hypothetical protein